MALQFQQIAHDYGDVRALRNVSFTAPSGQVTCLLGPSGCGKTTLLRLAAGLLPVQDGEIRLGGTSLATAEHSPPPEKRPIGMVFQEGALFPHLTVAENIAFGLKQKRKSRATGDPNRIVTELLNQMGLPEFGQRYPHELSGGQRQRIALARALAPEPSVLLMDEPFANVDIVLRRRLRAETRHVLRERAATVLLVTHDPEEAMEIADVIVVMEAGTILQIGTPSEIFDNPQSINVGLLFGDGQRVTGTRKGDHIETAFGTWSISRPDETLSPPSASVQLLIRPGSLTTVKADADANPRLQVEDIRFLNGQYQAWIVNMKGSGLWIKLPRDHGLTVGDWVGLKPNLEPIHSFPS